MLEKAASVKVFEHSPLGKELKAQTCTAEKQYQKLGKAFKFNKNEEKILKSRAKTSIVYSKDFTFYKYHNINEFAKRSFSSKQNDLTEFKDSLETFYYDTKEITPNNEAQEKDLEKRKVVINTALNYMISF